LFRALNPEGVLQHFYAAHEVNFDILEGATLSL